jgi:hypothetical protein
VTEAEYMAAYRAQRGADTRPQKAGRRPLSCAETTEICRRILASLHDAQSQCKRVIYLD